MSWLTKWRFVSRVAREQQQAEAQFAAADDIKPIDQIIVAASRPGWNWGRVARDVALQIPAVLRGRNMICSISTLPLIQVTTDLTVEPSPLLEQIDPSVANVVTLAQTFEDLLFEGISWWQILTYGWDNFPVSARHVDVDKVSLKPPPGYQLQTLPSGIDPASVVWVEGKPVAGKDMIRFDSPNPALLEVARRTLRRAIALEAAAQMYADNPQMLGWFSPVDDADPVRDDEVEKILEDWEEARRERSTGYVPAALKYNPLSVMSPADLQLRQLQDRVVLDMANMLGLDPEDFGLNVTSRTYQNVTDRRQDRINEVLSSYMLAITQRLSMNDVTKRGRKVRHDLTEYLRADPKTRAEVDAIYLDRGVVDEDEVRAGSLSRPALTPAQRASIGARKQSAPQEPAQGAPPQTNRAAKDGSPMTRHLGVVSFSDAREGMRFTFDSSSSSVPFSADRETRTVKGLLLPFGPVGRNYQGRWRFAAGSVEWNQAALSRVKLNRDHDRGQLLGAAKAINESEDGIVTVFKVARGPAGDQALSEAEDEVLDGLSAEVDILEYTIDPLDPEVFLVLKSRLTGAAMTATPAFDDARLTSVAASATATPREGFAMHCAHCGQVHPAGTPCHAAPTAPQTNTFTTTVTAPAPVQTPTPAQVPAQAQAPAQESAAVTEIRSGFAALSAALTGLPSAIAAAATPAEGEGRIVVNPHGSGSGAAQVAQELPYRFTGGRGEHDFSTDLFTAAQNRGGAGEAMQRVHDFMAAAFAVQRSDVDELNPARNRPELWVGPLEYNTPIWDSIYKGAITDSTPFTLPKFASSSGLVAAHTEGTEPGGGAFGTTGQTITPGASSGKVEITRETIDQGGNPQLSTLLWTEILRAWFESLEVKAAAMLDALTPTQIAIATALGNKQLAAAMNGALAALQFTPGGFRMRDLKLNGTLFAALISATDDVGRPLYPLINPQNAQGETADSFGDIMVGSLRGEPAWALSAPATAVGSSYLYNRGDVHAWATAPRELKFEYEVKSVWLGVWGYTATACTRTAGVREITYDPVV